MLVMLSAMMQSKPPCPRCDLSSSCCITLPTHRCSSTPGTTPHSPSPPQMVCQEERAESRLQAMQASYQSLLRTAQEKLQQLRLKQGQLSAQMQTSATGSEGSHAGSGGGSGAAAGGRWGEGGIERRLPPWLLGAMGQLPLPTMPLR